MLVRQLEDEVVKAKTQASHTNPEVSLSSIGKHAETWSTSKLKQPLII